MTDINGTVTGIQDTPVSSTAPTDGYVLTYKGADSQWEPQPPTGLRHAYFTSGGTWVAPAGVTNVLLIGAGGGGGGGPAYSSSGSAGGAGGSGSIQVTGYADVTPGNSYTVAIGTGGAGGAPNGVGSNGGSTSFGNVFYANGASGGTTGENAFAGQTSSNICSGATLNWSPSAVQQAGTGGPVIASTGGAGITGNPGVCNFSGNGAYTGGVGGTAVTNTTGGGGGGAGPQGNGGAGGNCVSTGTSNNGSGATANTGAGGGGGGGTAAVGASGGNGGNGGSGYLHIVY